MPFTHYRTQGIFLKKEGRGEADQVFSIFTKDFGKLEVLGRAIRKIKSKLRSGADLFYFSEIEFIQGKAHKTLTDAILIDKFKNLRENPQRLNLAYQMADALDLLTGKEEKDESIWKLLIDAFQRLNNCKLKIENSLPKARGFGPIGEIENWELKIIHYYFLWNLFSLLGYKPELSSCPICQKKLLPETFYFVPKEGGVVCWKCLEKLSPEDKERAKEINVDTVKILRIFLSKNWEILPRLRIAPGAQKKLKEISELELNFLKEEFSKMKE